MAMRWYFCKNCGVSLKMSTSPDYHNCPNGGHHSWTDLGEVGNINYQCKHCGTLVQTNSEPFYQGCSQNNHHSWQKL